MPPLPLPTELIPCPVERKSSKKSILRDRKTPALSENQNPHT